MRPRAVVAALAIVAFTIRLAFQQEPASSDEAGLLMVGSQWAPGTSLYGDYWVDRPPGLVALYAVADALGGLGAIRVLGAVAAAGAVLAAAWLGSRTAPDRRWAPAACAAGVAALISHPLLDVDEVSAEILALPFLVAGLAAVVAVADSRPHYARWAFAAGAAGTAAVFVKQSLIDVWCALGVVTAVLLMVGGARRALRVLAGALAGSRGTSLAGLWDAVVAFRFEAGAVIAADASEETPERARNLGLAFVITGMPVLLLLLTRLRWGAPWNRRGAGRPSSDVALSWSCSVLLLWEAFAVVTGGSYWLHYLLLPVPGLAFLVAVAVRQTERGDLAVDTTGSSGRRWTGR